MEAKQMLETLVKRFSAAEYIYSEHGFSRNRDPANKII